MKNKNTLFSGIIIFFLLLLSLSPNLKADSEKETLENAQKLADAGIIVNNSTNTANYKIKDSISRREMLKIMLNLAGVKVQENCVGKFADLPASDWGCKYAETALNLGFIAPNKYFRPNDNVSKAESLKMIFKAKNIEVQKTTDWREGYVKKAVELGYSENFTDYDNASKRSFVFNIGAKTLEGKSISNDLMCLQVITPAKNIKTGECIEFPNSCIPAGYEKTNSCSNDTSFKKYKMSVSFTDSMNEKSVEENLKIYPNIKISSTWTDDKTLELITNEEINKELSVLVNILDEASLKTGAKLENTITKKFKISGEAKVDFVSPEGQLTDKLQNITARFSKPIVSLTNLDNQNFSTLDKGGIQGGSCPITISPSISGKCVWITTSTFQFRPENGFPAGARYNVLIPAGIKTIAGDTTEKSKVFEIVTPAFGVENYATNLSSEDKLNIIFNDEISLEDFKNNFSISGYKNDELTFEFMQIPTSVEGTFESNKAGVSVLPKTGEWGYGKTFSYTVGKNMKSARGNIGLNNDLKVDITTNDILVYANPFVFLSKNSDNLLVDMKSSSNKSIITKTNPHILFGFEKEIELDKSLFSLNYPFELSYGKLTEYKNGKLIEKKDDKTQIVMSITGNISSKLDIKVNLSKKAKSNDKTLTFTTKQENKIISYNQINYKKACLETSNDIGYNSDFSAFEFDKYGKIYNLYKIQNYTNDSDCKYEAQKNKYLLQTSLNPENTYKLNIKSSLLDQDNYPLDKDYSYSFTTGKALNEDKSVSIIDGREGILVPKSINPLGVSITSVNISQAKIEVCQGDSDMIFENNALILKNSNCNTKNININNLGFKPNISVLDLENIFGKTFDKSFVTLKVEKIDDDKTDYEKTQNYYISKTSFIFSNIGAVLKSGKTGTLWIYDFNSGKNIDGEVLKIDAYKDEINYDLFGNFKGTKTSFDKTLDFTNTGSGTYKINGNNYQKILITLKSGEKIYIQDSYNYADNNDRITTFLQTDKPLYKAGENVNIKGISRILEANSYKLYTGKMSVSVRNSKYKEILNKEVTLDKNGSFDLSFTLDKDANLGNYSISALGNSMSFAVEEYEKPDFKVEAKSTKPNYLTSEKGLVNINADYYIGLPLVNGEGTYQVNVSKYNFDGGKTNGYEWGENNFIWWDYFNDYSGDNFYKSGNFSLDENGKYTLGIDLDETQDKVYNISTTITDPNTKKSISSSTSFIGTKSDTFLGIKFDKYYYDFKDVAKIGFVSTNVEGDKKSSTNFKFRAYKVDYVDNEDGLGIQEKDTLLGEKTLKTDNSGITNENFTFDNYGEYRFEIETLDSKYKTTKTLYVSGGNILRPKSAENKLEILSDKESYNVGESAEIIISSPKKGIKALLTIEKLNEVLYSKVIDITDFNQKINIDVRESFLPNFTIGVYEIKDVSSSTEKLEELKNLRSEMLELEKSLQKEQDNIYTIYDLKILPTFNEENLDKDILTKLVNLRFKEQNILNEILPEYYIGSKDIKVNLDEISLNTKVKIDKNAYLPGDKQVINLEITDKNGVGINGNVTLKIIDESLLALKNNTSSIKDYFYSEKGNEIQTYSNLSNIIKRLDFAEIVKSLEEVNRGSGGGGFATETATSDDVMLGDSFGDLFSDPSATNEMAYDSVSGKTNGTDENSTKIRTEFKDLAFYNGSVEVVNGKAQIIVPKLPDNLTTWVISGFTYTTDTKVGDFENKFKVQKDLSILQQIPRFFINGDIANIGGLIVNNTSKDMEVTVNLDITNANVTEKSKTITLKANSSSLVEFEAEILAKDKEKNDFSNITLTAKSSNSLSDSIVLSKPIYPNDSGEYVFTNGSTEDLSYEEKINLPTYLEKNGYLEISLGASILTNLLQNLDKYLVFPYDDLYSKLAFLENAETLKNIYKNAGREVDFENIILTDYDGKTHKVSEVESLVKSDLKNYMQFDNGLSYYKNCVTSYYYPSCSSFEVTGKYLELGLEIDGIDNKKVLEYYENELKASIEKNKSYGILTTGINEFLPIAKWKDSSFIKTYFKPSESLSNVEKLEYLKLYRLLSEAGVNSEKYLSDLKNSLLIEARGTFLSSENNSYSTSLMLETLIENGSQEKLETENLARWILSNRNEDGIYYLSNLSQILKSINLYLEKVEDIKNVSFSANSYLNGNIFMTGSFDNENKFSIKNGKFDLDGNINFGQENSLGFEKTGAGKLYYDVGIRYFLPTSKLEARDEGLIISRNYYDYDDYKNAFKKTCFFPWWSSFRYGNYCNTTKVKNIDTINSAKKGDTIVGEVELIIDRERTNVVVKDFLPAGAEILNTNFDTTSTEVKDISGNNSNSWYSGFDYVEQKDNMIYLYASHLTPGTYKYTYVIKASYAGKYSLKPATAELLDKPEIWGRSKGVEFEIK